ncbi:MAG: nucleoside deaminase [Cyclobacteriaceae bacterium]|nr:nucleoside deaminase [Cyclobacteriaceae bacterium]
MKPDSIFDTTPEYFMREALKQAAKAFDEGEVPVGAVLVCNNKIISRAYNQVELLNDPTGHAEILAITAACSHLGIKYLQDCTLYVTLEPCLMCAGALYWSQLGTLVYGASDPKRGYTQKAVNALHPKTKITSGVLKEKCEEILKSFFSTLRN